MALVIVEYSDLLSGADLTDKVAQAYGPSGLGVIAVRGVPDFVDDYRSVLSQAHGLAHLDNKAKKKLEDKKSLYNAGWSFGKEKLGDKPDKAKGSFYFNPLNDNPGTLIPGYLPEKGKKYPFFLPPNRWPESLPDLKPACQKLGKTVHAVTALLAKQVDALAAKKLPNYPPEECGSPTNIPKFQLLICSTVDADFLDEILVLRRWCKRNKIIKTYVLEHSC